MAGAALLSIFLRLRFVSTPITSDEGGYLAIARAWRHGAVLHRDVWVDSPQGMLALDRVWDAIGLGSPQGIRVLAIVAGVVAARLTKDEAVARWFTSHRQTGETLYVLSASAAFYANAREDPPYPHLWLDNVRHVPGAQPQLESLFTSDRRLPSSPSTSPPTSATGPCRRGCTREGLRLPQPRRRHRHLPGGGLSDRVAEIGQTHRARE